MGSFVGGLVGGIPKRHWYWAHMGFFTARTNCCFLIWNGKEGLGEYQQQMFNIQYEDLMMLRFYNTKFSMLYNLLKVDEAWCFILDKLLDKTTVQGWSAACGQSAVLH